MPTQLTVFDGARCIGGSKIHLKTQGLGLFLDFGMNFGAYGQFYEEFVQPRSARGIHDLWVLGLIPHLEGIYRPDIFPSDFVAKSTQPIQLDAIFVSHAHLDHTGNIGLLKSSIPLYTSGMTAAIIKAMQDCGRSSFESEITYAGPRCAAAYDPRAIGAVKGAPCQGREVRIVDSDLNYDKFNDFWMRTFSTKKIDHVPLTAANGQIGSLAFKAFPVDHSIFGATAYAFETPEGWIAYSGDLRLHGARGDTTRKFVEELAALKPHALVVEGTNISEEKGSTEDEVYVNCLKAAQKAAGRLLIADFGPRNIERLEIFLAIAREVDRRLLITAKDAFMLHAMHAVDETIPDVLADPNLGIFDEIKASMDLWEKNFVRVDYRDKFVSAQEIKGSEADYIMAFGFFDLKHLLDVIPRGGVYIYSTSEAFSEEMELDVRRLKNWLDFLSIEPVGFQAASTGELTFLKGYHASGHISGSELIDIIKIIKPKTLIPVHTEKPELFIEKLAGEPIEICLPEQGVPLVL